MTHAVLFPALALGSSTAQAALVFGSGPLTVTNGGSFDWDIDSAGGAEATFSDTNAASNAVSMRTCFTMPARFAQSSGVN